MNDIAELMEKAKKEALKLVSRMGTYNIEEQRLIATSYMIGFCEGNLLNGSGSKTEKFEVIQRS